MTKDKLPQEYLQWIEEEKTISHNRYKTHKDTVGTGLVPVRSWQSTKRSYFLRIASAAILVLALGVSMWVKRDAIFKPKYTEEQIALSYDQTLRALALCANSLSNEMNQLDKLKQIPESIDNLKKLGTIINN